MFNKVILVGNLTRDIEMRNTPTGLAIANTAIATSRKFKSSTGEQKEETCFVDIAFFGRTAEIAHQYLRKGSKVLVDGRLKLDQWTDANGQKRSKHSVTVETMQMLGVKSEESFRTTSNADRNLQSTGYEHSYSKQQSHQAPVQKAQDSNKEIKLEITEEIIPF